MAVSFVGSASASTTDGTDPVIDLSGLSLQADDYVYIIGVAANSSFAGVANVSTTGYTEIVSAGIGAGVPGSGTIQRKKMGSTPDSSATCAGSGSATYGAAYTAMAFRGVDTTTPEDVTTTVDDSGTSINPPSIDPVTDDCMIVAWAAVFSNSTLTGPSGYSNLSQVSANASTLPWTVAGATKLLSGNAAEDPGAFSGSTSFLFAATVALRPATSTNTTITAAQGSFTLSGQTANLRYFKTTAEQGTFTLTGQAANTSVGIRLTADQGSFVLSGQAANTLLGRVLAADQGSFTLSGQAADLLIGEVIAAGQGTFTLSGQAAATLRGYYLGAEQGSYALDGQDIEIRYFKLAADVGSFALTGQDATLFKGYVTTAAQGSFTLTGQAAGTFKGYKLALARGLYNLTGYDAAFTAPTWQFLPINTADSWTDVSTGTAENWVDVDTGDGETWT